MENTDHGLLPFDDGGRQAVLLSEMPELVAKSQQPCPLCRCKAALNPHRMCKQKVALLRDLARFLRDGDAWVRVEEGRGLRGCDTGEWRSTAYRARAHVSRCGWYGLTDHLGHRMPDWRISTAGLRFLQGELAVPEKILCTDGVVIYESIETVSLGAVKDVELDKSYWDSYPWSDMAELLS